MKCSYCEYTTGKANTLSVHIRRNHPQHKENKVAVKNALLARKLKRPKIASASKLFPLMSTKREWDTYGNISKWRELCNSENLDLHEADFELDIQYFCGLYSPEKFYVQAFTAPDVCFSEIPWVLFDFPIKTKCFCNLLKCMQATEENLKYILENRNIWHEHHILEVTEKFYQDDSHRSINFFKQYFQPNSIRIKKIKDAPHFLNLILYLASPFNSRRVKSHFSFGNKELDDQHLKTQRLLMCMQYPLFEMNQYHNQETDPVGFKLRETYVKKHFRNQSIN